MIIILFPSGATAGRPDYLLTRRADRQPVYIGAPWSYMLLVASVHTPNPYVAGVLAWDRVIADFEAFDVARRFRDEFLLAGADPLVVPNLLVRHLEPWGRNDRRTTVHFSVLNYHLLMRRSIRLYQEWRDGRWLMQWQQAINRRYGWVDPADHARTLVAAQRRHRPPEVAEQMGAAQAWLAAKLPPAGSAAAVQRQLACLGRSLPAAVPGLGGAILRQEATEFSIKFYLEIGGRRFRVATYRNPVQRRSKRFRPPSDPTETLARAGVDGVLGRVAGGRRALFERQFPRRWAQRAGVADEVRRAVLSVHRQGGRELAPVPRSAAPAAPIGNSPASPQPEQGSLPPAGPKLPARPASEVGPGFDPEPPRRRPAGPDI